MAVIRKKAPKASENRITSFFRPIKASKEQNDDECEDGIVSKVINLCTDDFEDEVVAAEEKVEVITIADPIPKGRREDHPFFAQFCKKAEDDPTKEAEAIVKPKLLKGASREAPLFPRILGTMLPIASTADVPMFERRDSVLVESIWSEWNASPITAGDSSHFTFEDADFGDVEEDEVPLEAKSIDSVFEMILKQIKGDKSINIAFEEDEDDWLPGAFRQLQKPKVARHRRHLHVVSGPSASGKTLLAQRLATALGLELVELSASCSVRSTKSLEDLLIKSAHGKLQFGKEAEEEEEEERRFVVLIDEIDVVFEGDRPFLAGLASYLTRVPPSQIVIMTANAGRTLLERHYPAFPADCQFHQVTRPVKENSIPNDAAIDCELLSLFDRRRVRLAESLDPCSVLYRHYEVYSAVVHGRYCPFIPIRPVPKKLTSLKTVMLACHRISRCSSFTSDAWAVDVLPVWKALERLHLDREEERMMAKRQRRAAAAQRRTIVTAHVNQVPTEISALVLNW